MGMHLLRLSALKLLIIVAIALSALAVIVGEPVFWEITVSGLAAVFLVSREGPRGWRTERSGTVDAANARALRLPGVRITVRGMMTAVALVAIVLWPVHRWRQKPYYEERGKYHELLAELCSNEARLMMRNADLCSARANRGIPWDDVGQETEDLQCCPYPSDRPQNGSWTEQAAVWERAARKSQSAAERRSSMRDYCTGWSPIKLW
jgi:hypothetical protein